MKNIRLVAFSGGGGANILSYLKGGRKVIAERLEKEFPDIEFMAQGANKSVDLVLTPNCISKISNTKSRLTGDAPSMKISEFLTKMKKPWLIDELRIVPATVQPRSPRCSSNGGSTSGFWPRMLFYKNQDDAISSTILQSEDDFLNLLDRDDLQEDILNELPNKNEFLYDVQKWLKKNNQNQQVINVDTQIDSGGGQYFLIPLNPMKKDVLKVQDWRNVSSIAAVNYL